MDEVVKIIKNMNKVTEKRWFEMVERGMEIAGVCEKDARYRVKWKIRTRVDPK